MKVYVRHLPHWRQDGATYFVTFRLHDILQTWKGFSGRRINVVRGTAGAVWQRESFDRIIRDEEHLWRAIQYIGRNPAKAGLHRENCRLWLRPAWIDLGWRFDP